MTPIHATIDGRSARRERNRQAVVEAVLELMDEGSLDPSVEEITTRSGVSQRSIFRYFDGLDDLRRAVIHQHFSRVEPMLAVSSVNDGPFETRARKFVNARLKLYDVSPNPTRVARTKAPYAPLLADDLMHFREVLDDQVYQTFSEELSERTNADATDIAILVGALVSFDSWEQMVAVHGRSTTQIRRGWMRGISALFQS